MSPSFHGLLSPISTRTQLQPLQPYTSPAVIVQPKSASSPQSDAVKCNIICYAGLTSDVMGNRSSRKYSINPEQPRHVCHPLETLAESEYPDALLPRAALRAQLEKRVDTLVEQ